MTAKKYIGGEFDQESEKFFRSKTSESFFPASIDKLNVQFYESGSNAVAALINEIRQTTEVETVYFPKHYCFHTIELINLKLDNNKPRIKYYSAYSELKKISSASVVILMHLNIFNKRTQSEIYKLKTLKGFNVIEDFVHCPLDIHFTKGYAFNSMRKFCSVDLSIAYGINKFKSFESKTNTYLRSRNKAKKIKAEYFKKEKPELEKKYLELFRSADGALFTKQIVKGNKTEFDRLNSIDLSVIITERKKNYKTLSGLIRNIKGLKILNGDHMFLMITTANRNRLKKFLASKMIFCPVHWPDSGDKFMRERSLSLPVDHRLNKKDMLRFGEAIKQFYKSGN